MANRVKIIKLWNKSTFQDIIDVRSPAEFDEDHIIGSINCPVLNNEERIFIGKTYKNINPFKENQILAQIFLNLEKEYLF